MRVVKIMLQMLDLEKWTCAGLCMASRCCSCYAGDAVISMLYYHVEILRSVPGQGEIYTENSLSAARPAHSAVMSRPGLYLVESKAARE